MEKGFEQIMGGEQTKVASSFYTMNYSSFNTNVLLFFHNDTTLTFSSPFLSLFTLKSRVRFCYELNCAPVPQIPMLKP